MEKPINYSFTAPEKGKQTATSYAGLGQYAEIPSPPLRRC